MGITVHAAWSPWKAVYQRYRQLERSWSLGAPPAARSWEMTIFRRLIRPKEYGSKAPESVAAEVRQAGGTIPDSWDEVAAMSVPIHEVHEAKTRWDLANDTPFEDVYQAALAMTLGDTNWLPTN